MTDEQPWWIGDGGVRKCGRCGCPVQRIRSGSLVDGMRQHFDIVHPGAQIGAL